VKYSLNPQNSVLTIGRMNKRLILLSVFLAALTALHSVSAKTVTAASPSLSDVSNAVNAASDGDTVLIPAGSAVWTSTLTVSKWLSIVGAGIDVTTIVVNVANPSGYSGTAGIVMQGGGLNQISGITFDGNYLTAWPAVTVWGGANLRIHHSKFVNCRLAIQVAGPFGVIDHNQFVNNHGTIRVCGWGDGSSNWSKYYPIDFTSNNYLFIEDNAFTMNSGMPQNVGDTHAWVSAGQGSSYVVRNNTFNQSSQTMAPCFDWHGDSNDGTRGNLSSQVYNNTLTLSGAASIDKFVSARGGQALIYNNKVTCTPGYGGSGIAVAEEWPSGTIVKGVRVYDIVTNQWQWGNTINGSGMGTFCISGSACSMVDYRNGAYPGNYAQAYPHPLVTSSGDAGSTGGGSTGGGSSPGSIRIVFSSTSVNETAGSVSVSLLRESGNGGAVGISYATSDGTALAGTQYTARSGTLSWADGDTATRTVEIPVANLGATGTKTLTFAISNPSGGATLGSPATSTITIVGNGGTAGTAPAAPTNLRLVKTY
jgi:hypothetical protein